jgi:hypothetical protein
MRGAFLGATNTIQGDLRMLYRAAEMPAGRDPSGRRRRVPGTHRIEESGRVLSDRGIAGPARPQRPTAAGK